MKIRHAVALFVTLISLVFAVLGFALIRTTDLLDHEARNLAVAGDSVALAKEIKNHLLAHNMKVVLNFVNRTPQEQTNGKSHERIKLLLMELENLVADDDERQMLESAKSKVEAYFLKTIDLQNTKMVNSDPFENSLKHIDEAVVAIDEVITKNEIQMKDIRANIEKVNAGADKAALILICFGCIILTLLIAAIIITVAKPLASLNQAISEYMVGDNDNNSRVNVKGLAEISSVAKNFNSMIDRLEERRDDQLRFIASVAHDLRNPLTSIYMISDFLLKDNNPNVTRMAEIIFRQVKSLDRLVGDLLDTTRSELSTFDLKCDAQDIVDIVRDVVELHSNTSNAHHFVLEFSSARLQTNCDRERLTQVLNNLISNAIKYSPNGGKITLKAKEEASHIIISIEDQGIGIDAQDLVNIFKPFHRTKATRAMIPGIGLGLSVSRRIIEAHGGTLTLQSKPGKGTTFYISIPQRLKSEFNASAVPI